MLLILKKKKSSLSLFEEIYSQELIPYDFAKTNKDTSQDKSSKTVKGKEKGNTTKPYIWRKYYHCIAECEEKVVQIYLQFTVFVPPECFGL